VARREQVASARVEILAGAARELADLQACARALAQLHHQPDRVAT
jgi:hypothetical protein